MRRENRSALYVLFIAAMFALSIAPGIAFAAGPSAGLSPADVVRAQLAALRDDDAEGAYRYASPSNHAAIGDPSDFRTMLERQYSDMFTQSEAQVTVRGRDDDRAQVLAELTQPNGQQSAYVFILSRQTGGACDGCWMTDGVLPLQPANDQPLYGI